MADLPLIFNSWRDPQGYRLDDSQRYVVRKGRPADKLDALEPLTNKALCFQFANTVVSAEGLLKFVQSYGALTDRGNDQGEVVDYALWHAGRMRDLFQLRSVQRRKAGRTKWLGVPAVPMRAAISWDRKINVPRWVFWPNTLLDGLWLQAGQTLTGGTRIQTCRHCEDWFPVGYPSERRLDSKFCCDEHRVQYNSRKRSKGE